MRNYLLIFYIAGLSLFAEAQDNSYLLNNPVWQQTSSCSAPAPCIQNENYNYYIIGDSVVNTLTYKKVYRKGQGSYSWMAPPPNPGCDGTYWYIDTVSAFFLRSSSKQMFVRFPSDTTEYLLYDFNLAIGDSLPLTYNNFDNAITVTAVDSFYTSYGYRKRFTLSGNTWSQYLIEGVGHSGGLIETMQSALECGFNLQCYSLNDTSYYPSLGQTCNLAVGKVEIKNVHHLTNSPNPFSVQTILQTTLQLKNATLRVVDFSGHIVKEIKNIYGHKIVITRDNLLSGLYLVRLVQDDEEITTEKLIIIDN